MSDILITVILASAFKPQKITVSGRNAWALIELIDAGDKGCTPIDNPAPAWAAYVQKLRAMGFDIETLMEPHGGAFKGHHGRYVLRSDLTVISHRDLDDAA